MFLLLILSILLILSNFTPLANLTHPCPIQNCRFPSASLWTRAQLMYNLPVPIYYLLAAFDAEGTDIACNGGRVLLSIYVQMICGICWWAEGQCEGRKK